VNIKFLSILVWRDEKIWFWNGCSNHYSLPTSRQFFSTFFIRFRYSFIYQGTSTRRQRSDLFGRGNPVKCLAQGHNKRTCQPISTL